MKFLSNLDLQHNQLIKAVLQNVAGGVDGSGLSGVSGVEGQIIYNTDNDLVYIYTGSAWATIGSDATITITAGDKINGGGSFNLNDLNDATITLNHDTTTVTPATSSVTMSPKGNFTVIDSLTYDTYGHITGFNVKTVTLPDNQDLVISFDGGTTEGTDKFTYDGETAKSLNILGGDKISLDDSSAGTIVIDHDPLAQAYATAADDQTVLANVELLNSLTVDGYGHVSAAEYRKLVAGTYLGITAGADGNITFAHDNTTRTNTTSAASPAFEATFDVVDSVTTNATGHVTGVNVKTVTVPTETDLSLVDAGTGTWLTGVAVNDHEITLSRSNTTEATIQVGELTISNTGAGSGDLNIDGNAVIGGNLTVSGTVTTVNTETIALADNIIELNSNIGANAPSQDAGIEINRGTETNYQFIFDETLDEFRIGEVGGLQPVLTRDEVGNLTDGEILIWDETAGKAIGGGDLQDLGGVKKYAGTITGDGSATSFNVANATHTIGNKYMTIGVYEASTGEQVFVNTVVNQTTFAVTFSFATAPVLNKVYEFVLIG